MRAKTTPEVPSVQETIPASTTPLADKRQLDTGSAVINSTLLIYNSFDVPMGGIKQSGVGRRHGEHGILRYTQAQSIVSSIAKGGGYDGLLLRLKNEKMVKAMVAGLKLWRKIPWAK